MKHTGTSEAQNMLSKHVLKPASACVFHEMVSEWNLP